VHITDLFCRINKLYDIFQLHLTFGDFDLAKRCFCKAYKLNVREGRNQLITQLKKVVFVLQTLEQLRQIDESEYLQRKKIFEQLGDCVVSLKSFSKAVNYYKKMLEVKAPIIEFT
jgi:tetratricopeptide (TPR) repeat protein